MWNHFRLKRFFWIYILFFAPSYMFINILENRGKVLNDIQGMLQQCVLAHEWSNRAIDLYTVRKETVQALSALSLC